MAQKIRIKFEIEGHDGNIIHSAAANGWEIELPDYAEVSTKEHWFILWQLQYLLPRLTVKPHLKHLFYQFPGTNAVVETANGPRTLAERYPRYGLLHCGRLTAHIPSQNEALGETPPADAPQGDAP
ncbi:MAG: hypothetical protein RL660_460 [Bacteroidota bacterium]|jgi:hypothetical protein